MAEKMHLKCPKCGYDISVGIDKVQAQIDDLGQEIYVLTVRMAKYKAEHGSRDGYYKKLVHEVETKRARLQELKQFRKVVSWQRDAEMIQQVKNKLRELMGKEAYIKFMQETENELYYDFNEFRNQHGNDYAGRNL